MSKAEEQLEFQLRAIGYGGWHREYKFHPSRKWRFDFAHFPTKLAVEVEGGLYVNGRHNQGAGFEKDLEKYQEAMLLGWTVYRVSPRMVKKGEALQTIEKLMGLHD